VSSAAAPAAAWQSDEISVLSARKKVNFRLDSGSFLWYSEQEIESQLLLTEIAEHRNGSSQAILPTVWAHLG